MDGTANPMNEGNLNRRGVFDGRNKPLRRFHRQDKSTKDVNSTVLNVLLPGEQRGSASRIAA